MIPRIFFKPDFDGGDRYMQINNRDGIPKSRQSVKE